MIRHWKETRDYRRVRDANGVVIACVISVDGEDVEVTEEIYKEYARMDRRERYLAEKDAENGVVSLDELTERGFPAEFLRMDFKSDFENDVLEPDEKRRTLACLERRADRPERGRTASDPYAVLRRRVRSGMRAAIGRPPLDGSMPPRKDSEKAPDGDFKKILKFFLKTVEICWSPPCFFGIYIEGENSCRRSDLRD